MKRLVVFSSLILLSACTETEHAVEELAANTKTDFYALQDTADDIKDAAYNTGYKIERWALSSPKGPGNPKPIKASYCYKVYQDVLCYRQPMPGGEYRMVGYQGTDAEPPPLPVMHMLKTTAIDPDNLPENRVAKAQPVFVELPETVKEKEEKPDPSLLVPDPDSTHEQLPDPALAPQL